MYHDIHFTSRKIARLLSLVESRVYRRWQPLEPFAFLQLNNPTETPPAEPPPGLPRLQPNTYWGGQEVNFALYGSFTVPADFAADRLALFMPLGDARTFSHPESLVHIDGIPIASNDRHHQELRLDPRYADGQPHALLLHGWIGMIDAAFLAEPGKQVFLRACGLAELDLPTRAFGILARMALQAADLLADGQPERARLYNALDDAFALLDTRDPASDAFYESVPAALEALQAGVAAAGQPLDVELIAAGHAHIDVAWLWTLDQTRRKAARTFYNALQQMQYFPNFHFTQSQPQLYDYIRQDDPALFETIKQRVAEGRWEVIGGAWVEPDCNLSGGESLARQFLLGRSFFRQHFGPEAESPVLWLPDVFGYAWNLPQLIKLAGLEYFFTIKLGWNQFNKLPMDSFWWQGLDGTRVLTHFSTAPESPQTGPYDLYNMATYNADLKSHTVLGSWAKLKHKESQRTLLMSYGWGDGGGGPSRENNENAEVLAAMPGLPRVRQGKVIDFFRTLEAESGDRLPVWNGELYLELHRGTYTSQSRNKRANRQSEFRLHDAEFLAATARLLDPTFNYPHEELRRAWELVCLNQFHDIIPGSSITAVYTDSLAQYAEIFAIAEQVQQDALAVIQTQLSGDLLLINPAACARWNPVVFWPGQLPAGMCFDGEVYVQPVEGGTLLQVSSTSGYSLQGLKLIPGQAPVTDTGVTAAPDRLENEHVRVEFNAAGDITRIYDKAEGREVLPPGAIANQWQAFEDRPVDWEAWDVDIFFEDKLHLAEPAESIRVVESGPLRATLEIRRRILNSVYTQRISLTNSSARLDFETVIDWRERHKMLKAAFPVDVLSPVATYEVQWGNVQRPTHRNTSWDWARFEVCAQKWVDLSEGGYGVALLNDCKYGHDIHDNVIRISLLRAPTYPDPQADQGEHRFTYSLLPHSDSDGSSAPSSIAAHAYALNDPLLVVAGQSSGAAQRSLPLVTSAQLNVIIETVKQAEDGDGLIIRAYECNRQRGPATFHFGFPLESASVVNLLEEELAPLTLDGERVTIPLKPYQIITLRVRPAGRLQAEQVGQAGLVNL
ncbi:MAG: alpha-mannosidase [Anaerolineae bacterium]|nr:alpha-mannosidase [Anaerolineae bacterium]